MHLALAELQGDGGTRILIEAHDKTEIPWLELQVFPITVRSWNSKKSCSLLCLYLWKKREHPQKVACGASLSPSLFFLSRSPYREFPWVQLSVS